MFQSSLTAKLHSVKVEDLSSNLRVGAIEKKKMRTCLAQKSSRCKKVVFGYSVDRKCIACKQYLIKGNYL